MSLDEKKAWRELDTIDYFDSLAKHDQRSTSTANPEPAGEPGPRPLPESYSTPWTAEQVDQLSMSIDYVMYEDSTTVPLPLRFKMTV